MHPKSHPSDENSPTFLLKVSNRARNVFHLTSAVRWQVEQRIGQTLKEPKIRHLDHVVDPRGLWSLTCNRVVQMIRIKQVEEGNKKIFRVEGWLQSEEVTELRRVTEAAGTEVALDLSELRMTDRRGIEVLRSLADQGVELRHMSPLIALLLGSNQTNRRSLETTKREGSRGNAKTLSN